MNWDALLRFVRSLNYVLCGLEICGIGRSGKGLCSLAKYTHWYFEIDEKGYPNRQIEKYDNGKVLKYDLENMEDEFGGLGDQIIEIEEFSEFEITKEKFTREWK